MCGVPENEVRGFSFGAPGDGFAVGYQNGNLVGDNAGLGNGNFVGSGVGAGNGYFAGNYGGQNNAGFSRGAYGQNNYRGGLGCRGGGFRGANIYGRGGGINWNNPPFLCPSCTTAKAIFCNHCKICYEIDHRTSNCPHKDDPNFVPKNN